MNTIRHHKCSYLRIFISQCMPPYRELHNRYMEKKMNTVCYSIKSMVWIRPKNHIYIICNISHIQAARGKPLCMSYPPLTGVFLGLKEGNTNVGVRSRKPSTAMPKKTSMGFIKVEYAGKKMFKNLESVTGQNSPTEADVVPNDNAARLLCWCWL